LLTEALSAVFGIRGNTKPVLAILWDVSDRDNDPFVGDLLSIDLFAKEKRHR